MKIKFVDYLSEAERKEIVVSVFKERCEEAFLNDGKRILSNVSYEVVQKMVDNIFDGKLMEILTQRTVEIINNLTFYTVFKRKDHWDAEDSAGFKLLNEIVQASKPLIQARITEIINALDEEDMKESLRNEAISLLDIKLFGGK